MKIRIRGSLTVEAAVMIPFVIIIMLPFLYILRSLYVYDCVRTAVYESAQLMENVLYLTNYIDESDNDMTAIYDEQMTEDTKEQMQGYESLLESISDYTDGEGITGLAQNIVLQQVVRLLVYKLTEDQNLEAWGLVNGALSISYIKSRFFYEEDGRDALFCIIARYDYEFPFVSRFADMDPIEIQCMGRAYVGTDAQVISEDIGDESNENQVKYRIGNGNHYHIASCYLIAKDIVHLSKDKAESQGYIRCNVCKPNQAVVMATVGGEKYHTEDCRYIAPHLTAIDESEINEYIPCDICIGGGTWFQ